MNDREYVIKGEHVINGLMGLHGAKETMSIIADAIALLKEQEAHIVTETDFENADIYGFLPAWCEERYTNEVYCECIKKEALHEAEMRYWTARPTDEQRKAVKWDE